jgi:4-amino-4-deoxy-L-arabinose transferase-like glycosyltransferase
LLWLLVRGSCFGLSQNYSYDAVSRTVIAQQWLKQPRLIPYRVNQQPTQYTPLPIYLMGLSLALWNQPLISPRLVNLIFGCLTLLPFYYLIRLEFDQRTALYASLFMAFFTLHIKSSIVASSEATFCFFLLCGVYQIYKFKQQRHKRQLILAAVFINLAVMSRYTGLLYIPLLCLLIVDRSQLKSSLSSALLFLGLCLILPGLWLLVHHITLGQALFPFKYITKRHIFVISQFRSAANRLYYLPFWPAVVALSLTPVVAGLSLMGMWESLHQRKHLGFLLLICGPYLFFMYRSVIVGDFYLMPRYVIDSSIFLLPFAVIGMYKVQSYLPHRWQPHVPKLTIGSIILCLILVMTLSHSHIHSLADKMKAVSPLAQLEPSQQWIASFLRQKQPRGQIILDNNPTWSELEIMFYSSLPRERFTRHIRQPQALIDYIKQSRKQSRPAYLILLPQGWLSQELTPQTLNTLPQQAGFQAKLVFEQDGYRLYKLVPIL